MLTDYVQNVTNDSNVSAPGIHIAEWVIEHNPGNAPEHAGPPAHAGPGGDNTTANETDGDQGPPDHAGNGDDTDNETDDGQGPPDHTGDDDEEEDDEEEDDGNGAGNGPPAGIFAFLPFF
jgi:hypothetical protein